MKFAYTVANVIGAFTFAKTHILTLNTKGRPVY